MSTPNELQRVAEAVAEEFVSLVREIIDAIAPGGPWWSEPASPEEQMMQWLAVRPAALSWLAEFSRAGFLPEEKPIGEALEYVLTDQELPTALPPGFPPIPPELRDFVLRAGLRNLASRIARWEELAAQYGLTSIAQP